MSLELKGKVYAISDAQQITSTFTKREFVIITDEQYPQHVKFELVNDKTGLIDSFAMNQEVTVYFNVRGREWQKDNKPKQYFVSLNAWRIESNEAESEQVMPVAGAQILPVDSVGDDLPF